MKAIRLKAMLCATAAATGLLAAAPVWAQAAPPQSDAKADAGEIIVTARKRQESLLAVPVIAQVVTQQQLLQTGTVDLKDVTKLAPGLMVGTAVLSIGQQVSLRGVGTSSFDPGIDQSVSLNIDGLPLTQGLAYSSGVFDIAQIEVLEGPQALFFGKSSPGGVISFRTADPTDKFELIGRFGYEAEAHTKRSELIVSGPVSDTLKLRLAGMYSKSDGYYRNLAVVPAALNGLGGVTPKYDRMNASENYQIRGTALWSPSSSFDARLKVNIVHDYAVNPENFQLTSCPDGVAGPFGIPFINPADTCTKDRNGYIVDYNPANFPGILNGGTPFVRTAQQYGTLELNWHLAPDISLTSVTGFYHVQSSSLLNTSQTGLSGPLLAAENPDFHRTDVTEELRLNSDFSTPLNFTAGAFFQDSKVSDHIVLLGNPAINPAFNLPAPFTGLPFQDGLNQFSVRTYSLYGQVRYKITDQLELAAGARWTDETRIQSPILYPSATALGNVAAGHQPPSALTSAYFVPVPTPRIHSSPVTPEVTLTYKPSGDLTIFAAYKRGAKSGSFSIATPQSYSVATNNWLDNSFGDEKVSGFEGGIKGRTADRQIHFSLSGYHYIYKGLQVGAVEPTVGSLPTIRTVNAGEGKVYGLEAQFDYHPAAISGLTLNAAVNWTHARYTLLNNVPCFGGQTVALGCNQQFVASAVPAAGDVVVNGTSGRYFAQDLSGTPFIRAPNWQGNFGFNYELPVGDGMKLILSNTNTYTTKYVTGLGLNSSYTQSGYIKVDLGLTVQGKDNRWELAFIGKNIGARHTTSNCALSNFGNGLLGGENPTGGVGSGVAGVDEQGCYMDSGRELWVRLTLRPFG
ncbi:MAG: hypothetical protein JWQ16_2287 [Novosphingobium sp.]|nr:hypothetical protein [Novosphingobium sp.]